MHLGDWPLARAARVVSVSLDEPRRVRLGELGLRPGALVRPTHRAAFGGRVVAIGADRFAVDADTCALIEVVPPQSPAGGAVRVDGPGSPA